MTIGGEVVILISRNGAGRREVGYLETRRPPVSVTSRDSFDGRKWCRHALLFLLKGRRAYFCLAPKSNTRCRS